MQLRMLTLPLLIILWSAVSLAAQELEVKDFMDLSLDELLNMRVTVASKTALSLRESPGIVTRIDAEEIRNAGARDLIDVLRLVPGIDFGREAQFTIGLSMRGNWASDGKVLVLLDGMPLNDLLYGNVTFGNRVPVDQIERIEIIRGPGSAIYGGFAEMGVIQIITRNARQLQGVRLSGTVGYMSEALGRSVGGMEFGKTFHDLELTASAFGGRTLRSDRETADMDDPNAVFSMKDFSEIRPMTFNVGLNYRQFRSRVVVENYHQDAQVPQYLTQPLDTAFKGMYAEGIYDWTVQPRLKITPYLNFLRRDDWEADDDFGRETYYFFDKPVNRWTGGLLIESDPTERINLLGGVEYAYIHSRISEEMREYYPYYDPDGNDVLEIDYRNTTFLGQLSVRTTWFNVTAGARLDHHSVFGSAFVPRLGLTRAMDQFHFKLLFSRAFRAPMIENISLNPNIKPEWTTVFEAEAGYRFNENMSITINLFDTSIKDVILYDITDSSGTGYINSKRTGSRGFEIEGRWRNPRGYLTLNYSFYRPHYNETPLYAIENRDDAYIGLTTHKITANGTLNLDRQTTLSPSVIFYGHRYGYFAVPVIQTPTLVEYDPVFLLNLFVWRKNVFISNLEIGIGVYDLLGENFEFIRPYQSRASLPFPGPPREVLLKALLHF